MVIPYTQGIAESFKNICGNYGIQNMFQTQHNHQVSTNDTKGPGPQGQEEWGHIKLPVWGYCLQRGVHRGNIKDSG